ncbi:MAG: exo-alpha-sialidase [Nitrospirales bacterium]
MGILMKNIETPRLFSPGKCNEEQHGSGHPLQSSFPIRHTALEILFCFRNQSDGSVFFVFLKGNYWNDAELYDAYSQNNGETWTDPVPLRVPRGTMVRSAPIQATGGKLYLPAYDERINQALVLTSHSPYTSWDVSHRFEDVPLIQPTIVHGPNKRLTMNFV